MSEMDDSLEESGCVEEYGSEYPTIREELADRGMSIHDFI